MSVIACYRQVNKTTLVKVGEYNVLCINMHRQVLTVFLVCLSLSIPLSARIPAPPGFEDIRSLAQRAPLVFRGEVGNLNLAKNEAGVKDGVAVIMVDRWYLGSPSRLSVNVHFVHAPWEINGHNCIDFEIGSYWIVFARPSRGEVLELVDDCQGALTVSSLLAPEGSGDFLSQIEEDFAAGLNDSASDARIASIQRLAGLGKIRSTEGLRGVIASGTEQESKWAIFAALKTGDVPVLPLAVPILLNLHHEQAIQHREPNGFVYTEATPYPQPEGEMALAISKLSSPEAVLGLTRLANEASDDFVRRCAREALLEIKERSGKAKK